LLEWRESRHSANRNGSLYHPAQSQEKGHPRAVIRSSSALICGEMFVQSIPASKLRLYPTSQIGVDFKLL
jgi:hypothetical protein